jgi:hypothetical protein
MMVRSTMPDRSKVMNQTKRDILILQFGGVGVGQRTLLHKKQVLLRKM